LVSSVSFSGEVDFDHCPVSGVHSKGCIWTDHRFGDRLLSIHLKFPPGTVSNQAKYAYEVRFPKGGMLWWSVKPDGMNGISVPYVYL
jgi:hypothetical protein